VGSRVRPRLGSLLAVAAGAALLRLIPGVGFANYDTLYALAWGGQLSRGQLPSYDLPVAPTPHPLLELLGVVLVPLGPHAAEDILVAIGFIALSGCGWLVYKLGAEWFGRAAGALAALLLLTRVPFISYGARAYVDIPFLALVLLALLVESRRRRAGVPVLALLALAGLLRPEAWAFSAVYLLYLLRGPAAPRSRAELVRLVALAASAPVLWLLSDLAVTGDPLWSLTNTRHTARTLGRVTGIANVPQYIPRRIGEILRPPVLAGAALGGVLSLLWLRARALLGALTGLLAVVVFAVLAAAGLSINTRYAFPAAALLCVFCGAGVFGWLRLARGVPARRWWMAGGAAVLVALAAYTPAQYRAADREVDKLALQQRIQNDLTALVDERAVTVRCGPVGVPNHAPVPLLALYLKTSPARIANAQVGSISTGQYLDPATRAVEQGYVLDRHDPRVPVSVPRGFVLVRANRSWRLFQRC
jgi:Dolichyl-phosphate-mannose-protein mannosyltransferase